MSDYNCFNCKKAASKDKNSKDFAYPCDCCTRVVCRDCTNLTQTQEVRCVPSTTRAMVYLCPECLASLKQLPALKEELKILLQSTKVQQVRLNELEQELTKKLKDQQVIEKSEVETINEQLKNLESKINKIGEDLQSHAQNTYQPQVQVQATIEATDTKQSFLEPAVNEFQEREKRKRNILMFGVKEQEGETPEARIAEKIIKDLDNSVGLTNIKVQRIGRFDKEKARPIRVIMESQNDAIAVLRKRSVLKGEIYIKGDMTRLQRQNLNDLLKELEARTSKGEPDLKIKYIKGIPRIVKSTIANTQTKN